MSPERRSPSTPRARVTPGTRLNGIYEIERLIGTGGMGEVYKGHAIQTGDPVAIKMVRPDLAENEAAIALFRKEASALHNLYHEAIVRYYVFTTDPEVGCPYLAMEFVDGQALSDILKEGPLSFDSVRVLQRRLAAGLQAAHELGIVHRDVSPDNIILPGGNVARAKIIDFGIARTTLFGEGTVIGSGFAGKYNYVSPEQLGLFGGEVMAKSDIYSLALVLAEALLGRPLDMGGSQVQVIEKRRKVPDLSAIDPRIRPLLAHMLQPNPEDRPESMAEVAAAGQPTGTTERGPRPHREGRRLPLGWMGGLVAAAGVAGAAVFFAPKVFDMMAGPVAIPPPPTVQEAPPLEGAALPDRPGGAPPSEREPSLAARDERPSALPIPEPAPAPPRPPPPQQAALPPVAPPTFRNKAEQVSYYLNNYEGGECFYVAPMTITENSASIEAYGATPAPFEVFDAAFKNANGFEAQIALRQVTPAQCPVVSFLRQMNANRERAPRLEIGAFTLRSGQSLTGTADRFGNQHVEILLVSDDGQVHNLTSANYATKTGNTINMNLRIEGTGGRGPKPQIVLAIASQRPLSSLAGGKPMAAERLFSLIRTEAERTGQTVSVAAKYFRLDG
jgi:hypothetical protein